MSRAHHQYPVASTSYHQPPPITTTLHRNRTAADRRQSLASVHPDLSQDIYIPESQEELNRVNIESRLLQPSGPRHVPDMRRPDLTSASSTFDTYDRIGREDDLPPTRPVAAAATAATTTTRRARASNMPIVSDRLRPLDADESLIPGVGRGVRSAVPAQSSYHAQLRSLDAAQNRFESSPARSPYRPGKYSSGYIGTQARQPVAASTARASTYQTRTAAAPRQAQVESESESDGDSASESAESDAINVRTATFNSTGNHRNFAATPAGHTATMTANDRQRPILGQDTLDRIEFDIYTDTDGEHRARTDAPATRASTQQRQQQHQQTQKQPRPRSDHTGPFASPRATNTFGMNAADYQQHLASRTLTSPALRTLIGDRSKSPDSPTPAPSIDGILHPGKTSSRETQRQDRHQQPRATRQPSISAVSAFEDLARRLQKDVELTRRNGHGNGEDMDDGSASNSGGSGFGPGSQASSARTRVEADSAPNADQGFNAAHFNAHGYPALSKASTANDVTSPWGVRLPDVTGLTSALGSPIKARDAVKHRPFDSAVGNQQARLDEIVNLRCFVDGIQLELDRAGERILNLEQAQEQQSQDFQGLRSEMQSALNDVRAQRPASDEQLVQLILRKLQVPERQKESEQQRAKPDSDEMEAQPQAQIRDSVRQTQEPVRDARATLQQKSRSQVEVVSRLYTELDKLRTAMEEQYRSAAGLEHKQTDGQKRDNAKSQREPYRHQDDWPSSRDPWEAIEALRLQVLSLADEVEGLNGLVLEQLVQPALATNVHRKRNARSSAARQRLEHEERYYQDAHPASDPIYTVRGSSARASARAYPQEHVEIRTDPVDQDLDNHCHRRVPRRGARFGPPRQAAADLDDEEYDQTIDAVAENLRVQRERQRGRQTPPLSALLEDELDDTEISQLAEARAARASARAGTTRHTHDERRCTVCTSSLRSRKQKASRRARILQAEQRREAVEMEESILLNSGSNLDQDQLATLQVILQEHWDEFLHQRMLYSELADELKTLDPTMSKTKRGILVQHVLEAVEMLEVKAGRIERLERLIKGKVGEEEEEERKRAGSRQASGSSGRSNRLKQALESFDRSKAARVGGRNSPPTSIRLE